KGSCPISVNVKGVQAGVQNNTTGPISSTESGPGAASNTASITVIGPPSISKAFGATSIPLNGSTSLSFSLQNSNTTQTLSGVGFTDTLPSGLVIATLNGLPGSCGGGTITAVAGSNAVSLTGASLTSSSICTFSANVIGTAVGAQTNTTAAVTSTQNG